MKVQSKIGKLNEVNKKMSEAEDVDRQEFSEIQSELADFSNRWSTLIQQTKDEEKRWDLLLVSWCKNGEGLEWLLNNPNVSIFPLKQLLMTMLKILFPLTCVHFPKFLTQQDKFRWKFAALYLTHILS